MAGAVCALAGLLLVWAARLWLGQPVYVSELGAEGAPTAPVLAVALLLVAVGGGAVAWAARGLRSRAPLVGRWAPALTLAVSSGAFALASQVTCTAGCPVPLGATFTWQDLAHVVIASLGFAAACVAMVQTAFTAVPRWLALVSFGAAASVVLVAGAGGLLALLRVPGYVGGTLEHVAASLALSWLAVLGVALALQERPVPAAGAPRGRVVANTARASSSTCRPH